MAEGLTGFPARCGGAGSVCRRPSRKRAANQPVGKHFARPSRWPASRRDACEPRRGGGRSPVVEIDRPGGASSPHAARRPSRERADAFATQRQLNDDYGHRLWLITDLREQEYQANWGYLEQTVNEVAQNARLPLMLAGSLIRDASKRVLQEPAVTNML